MGIIACKFGGTSTADAGMFRQIKRILEENPDRRYVVLSAPGGAAKVTDLLYRWWALRRQGADGSPLLDAIAERFSAIRRDLGMPNGDDFVRASLEGSSTQAETVSRGEYLCARLFSEWSDLPFVDAATLVRFDPSGRLDVAKTLCRFRAMSVRLPRAIIPGFYGSDPEGHIVVFPRNGSDITGALAAVGVGADTYENWSDVQGLMTADPAVDPGACLIPSISYGEMRRLAAAGTRVLHPDCLGPVARAGIPTRLRCTMRPDLPGTLVHG